MIKSNIDVIEYCAKTNTLQHNLNKALEESIEFQETIIKFQTKHPDSKNRPTIQDMIDEFGDLQYRGMIALIAVSGLSPEEVEELVSERVMKKLENMEKYILEGKYKGGL